MPLEENWIARAGSEDFARLVDYHSAYQPGARRFDMGERSHFHLMPAAIAALDQLTVWGLADIAETLTAMTERIAAGAAALGFTARPVPAAAQPEESARAGHYLGLSRPGGVPEGLLDALKARDIYVSVRGDCVRVTPHLWTREDEIARFLDALKDCL